MLPLWLGSRYALSRQRGGSAQFLVRMAVLSLALSVALLILVLAIMSGFEHELKTKILNLAPHISVIAPRPIKAAEQHTLQTTLRQSPYITAIEPVVELKALAVKGTASHAIAVSGVAISGHVGQLMRSYLVAGNNLARGRNILVSQALADELKLVVGEPVLLMLANEGLVQRQATVVALSVSGIFNTGTELDQRLALVPLETAQQLAGLGAAVTSMQLYTSDVMAASSIAYRLGPSVSAPMRLRDWSINQGNLYQAIQTSRQMVLLMLFVVVAVAAMNIVTAMTMVVTNKQREIAMLMTMGLQAKRALAIVLVQGLIIAALGIGCGVLLGVALAFGITDIVLTLEQLLGYQFLKSDIYPITYLPTHIVAMDILSVCLPALGITLLTAMYPAWRASKLQPAQVLRYDK